MAQIPTNRYEVEQMMKVLTGGASPEHKKALMYDKEAGFLYSKSGLIILLSDEDETEFDASKLKFQNGLFLVEEDLVVEEQVNVSLTPTYDGGSVSGTVTLDYLNGATQRILASGNITSFTKPDNLPDGSPMIVLINLQGSYDCQFKVEDFHANQFLWENPIDYLVCAIVDYGLGDPTLAVSQLTEAT